MAWLEIIVNTAPGTAEDIAARLTAGGFSDLVIEDQAEFETFLDQNKAYWDYIDEDLQEKLEGLSQIKLYLEDTDTAGLAKLTALVEGLGLTLTKNQMADTDWSESWKDNYPPVEVGERFVVLPYWLAELDYGNRLKVILDPGLTFGTGAHPSTQMVMNAMAEAVKPGSRCLDLGSGSGILSIAALRLGAAEAVGVDIDPKAETIAAENAGFNDFTAPAFTALTGNVTTDKPLMQRLSHQEWDVVLVNIVADVIIGLAPVLPNFLSEKSVLICSGILDVRLLEVIAALEKAGLAIVSTHSQEDWRCVVAKGGGQ